MPLDPRYPIGQYVRPAEITSDLRERWLSDIEQLPAQLREAVAGMTDAQLDTPYREGGWTIRQVVHHVVDSHIHSYIRCKFAMSMDNPTIMPYDEAAWACFADGAHAPVELSLRLLEALHARWTMFLRALRPEDFDRRYSHPEYGPMTLSIMLAMYSWHGRHHLAHIHNAPVAH
ncbi:MAG: putative metal-dependent hydrolase [Bryobacterales bacterium]|nr:putative metal-dependent hydrolase [Bryobacterales bacterium]